MASTEILLMFAQLVGGLAFFLYGMSAMSGGLEKMAGGALERTLKNVTKNEFLGFLLGAGITIAIQSSSAMTVMLVGLVNSGIIDFANTFGMIMGSNVGTTLTAWLLSLTGMEDGNFFLTLLQPMTFAPLLAFVGIIMQMVSKSDKKKNIGMIFIGFAVLMVGMDMMSNSMAAVSEMEGFKALLTAFESPIAALLISMVFTGVIQSSAATIGIVQALALAGGITYQMAIPLVLGANIGTCVTALISSFGTNKSAKRVVVMHISVNVIGSVVCMIALYIIKAVAPEFIMSAIPIWGVAVVHTLFNVITTIVLLPVRKLLIKLCEKIVPDGEEKKHTVFLDERLFVNSSLAIEECHRLTDEMANYAREAIAKAIGLFQNYSDDTVAEVKKLETLTDKYEDKLGTYLVRLSHNNLSEAESHTISRLLHGIGDFERIGDHALNICDAAQEMHNKNVGFSKNAIAELKVTTGAVLDILNKAVDSFINDDADLAAHIEPLEEVVDDLRSTLKERHIERLQNDECTVEMGFIFTDILTNYERVADHCSNIAVYTLQMNSSKLDAHKYLKKIKSAPSAEFIDEYRNYSEKYSLENI